MTLIPDKARLPIDSHNPLAELEELPPRRESRTAAVHHCKRSGYARMICGRARRPLSATMTLPLVSLLEIRVLGVLVEKQHTVRDTNPLTLKATMARLCAEFGVPVP